MAGLLIKSLLAVLVIGRVYSLVESDSGSSAATVAVVILTLLGVVIFSLGILTGAFTEWMVRGKCLLFKTPEESGSLTAGFVRIWGQEKPQPSREVKPISPALAALKVPDDFPAGTTMQDTEDWLTYINGRPSKGKKSKYPDSERFRAVRDWRIMQANGTSVTVQEFLEGRFGTKRRGDQAAQHVPHSTFYGWWPIFDEELAQFMEDRLSKRKQHMEVISQRSKSGAKTKS